MMLGLIASAFLGQAAAPRLPEKIDERVRASVVSIQNHTQIGQANGVIVDQAGGTIYVLTAAHFFDAGNVLSVTTYSPNQIPREKVHRAVRVEARLDKEVQDLAVLRVEGVNVPNLQVLPLAPVPAKKAIDSFTGFSVAFRERLGPQARAETVLEASSFKKNKMKEAAEFWKVKDEPELGRSGGPLVDQEGRLLGICSGSAGKDGNKAGYFTHISEIRRFLRSRGILFETQADAKKEKQ
jgi:S1-C subfamily serine protease